MPTGKSAGTVRGLLQFTLDMFGGEPQATGQLRGTSAPPKRLKTLKSDQNKALAPVPWSSVAPELEAHVSGVAPSHFRHPRANREIRLNQAVVGYEFKRGKRRTIGFLVAPDGLVVSAPSRAPLHQVESALQHKADWIIRKLGESQQRCNRQASAQIVWRDGVIFPFLGAPLQVVLTPAASLRAAPAVLAPAAPLGDPAAFAVRRLLVSLPHEATPAQIRDAVQAWLKPEAKRHFTERLNHFAVRLQVRWLKLSLSNAKTRWGSASSSGSIRLNWRLMHASPAVLDYVVVHELSHLRVMDHSPRFWDTVRSAVPEYAALRQQLKRDLIPVW